MDGEERGREKRKGYGLFWKAAPATPSKPYYVTTPIFYVNAAPHVGHMYSMILADVLKRWHALNGQRSLLLTGTDEHGLKIQQAAAANDTLPKQWCDAQANKFRALAASANLANDFFIRTTDEDHKDAVRHFWFLLKEKGLVYESKHEGWYCVSDEAFYPESMLTRKVDPLTGQVSMASIETGNTVEWTEEKNYHFRMTALKDQLLAFYEENPDWIVPRQRMREVVDWVTNNLEDLSISRPSNRLDWGIRVPDDDSQTIYVWVDALINYLTKAGFPNWAPGKQLEGGWPADVHVIGKDILRFHGVYWPALLLAVDIPPPKKLLSHAHWTMSGKKMSKSLGNVVNPFHALDRFGVDAMRFFMIHDGGIENDADYSNDLIVERYKKMLQGTIGNLLSRVTRAKAWNVRESILAGPILTADIHMSRFNARHAELFRAQEAMLSELHERMQTLMEKPNPRLALMHLMQVAMEANRFITEMAPWDMTKRFREILASTGRAQHSGEALDIKTLRAKTIFILADTLRNVGILLQPFMPGKAKEMLDVLGVSKDKRQLKYVGLGKDFSYGEPEAPVGTGGHQSLFPPLESEL
ncbi:hypothetical protein M406DRAFT_344381 [Cryphonectria parasitica EP155]|uniref:Probable methionine--tRNA ligase, mitochondrial n=1 Tax=Cryphonectria parasitica (strain ATCC 38755 / EP155) TaxID=660469 RepID=A0A9P5CV73_CRYP1|nr:uncharacterized protein M406DRAFT_344381 [Cryphonectria parasitica EP155]KAF3770901.1 hypothetical protein M406DRAFT_344381 [Cryphonectria parasitica EP155]